jgi:hypothetical protein
MSHEFSTKKCNMTIFTMIKTKDIGLYKSNSYIKERN